MSQTDPQVVAFLSTGVDRAAGDVDDAGVGIVAALWRYRWSSLAITAAAVALTACVGLLIAPGAQATAAIGLSTPPRDNLLAPDTQGEASLARYVEQRAGFVTSDAVLGAAVERLGRSDLPTLRRMVSADAASRSNLIDISVTAGTPVEAVEIADAVVWAYQIETERAVSRLADDAASLIEDDVQALERLPAGDDAGAAALLSDLRLQALELRRDAELFGAGVEFVNAPSLDSTREPGVPVRELGVGLILGLVAAGTVAWVRADHLARTGGDDETRRRRRGGHGHGGGPGGS